MTDEPIANPDIEELIAAGERRKKELVAWAGGLLDEEQAAARLGASVAELRERTGIGSLIAVLFEGRRGYPACQFNECGTVPGLEMTLCPMPIRSDWMRLEWLLTPDSALDDETPLEALRAGRREAVLDCARSHGAE
jgi:hypothetical protein